MHVDGVQVNLRIAVSMNHGLRIEESAALCELHVCLRIPQSVLTCKWYLLLLRTLFCSVLFVNCVPILICSSLENGGLNWPV